MENFILGFFDFVGNLNFDMLGTFLSFVLVIFWLVLIGWVWIDSGERTSKKSIRITYLLLVIILNIPGLIIYLIIRPSETIEEIYWADLERRYLKFETSELGDCPKCGSQLFPGFVFCTNCGFEIKKKCPSCGMLINKDHKHCEYCGTQVRERAVGEEQYPNAQVMEQQVLASKEHATQTVESKRTKYKTGSSFAVKLGSGILALLDTTKTKLNSKTKAVEIEQVIVNKDSEQTNKGKKKKKNKKKKRR
ncbi:hypothetical protein A3K02_02315 [candidate division WS6 bacterium RIFOXYD1_FULL_33_8]|uniref:DZANK-type domain-containing protein n=2 Tax=Candidatus Dojkabacteria TaxID=74243 RepID=A0A0G0AFE1_9BACT|nr:MAG: hypothetical protein UR32_C0003G0062 [candidate division WS6 bacterium GW2011_GWE2_33_157]KKP44671.1 MAG: hypothetical protein UR34_C0001G0017 [candidate division WS6 bacterium GW2011_GWC1_33_20]KKP45988.1 MAG: hypothetical protein UR36_C0002G0030 [candidate division WS6 bacterium GW2011_GWF1_33_233]KKP55499.1 MAG: hypothetical protein UR47_C0001G0060 [candidate division WS6 bacterium GW2011_GWB1_33_6]KKP55580.1 MAG: hypothetical protein UR45_C0001G0062 [candidate division WS6 bacterium